MSWSIFFGQTLHPFRPCLYETLPGILLFVYEYFFKVLDISFPLFDFECCLLTKINQTLSQLHPNSWTFLKAFQILCTHLSIRPSVNTFMYFYQLKHGPEYDYVLMEPNTSLFLLFMLPRLRILRMSLLNIRVLLNTRKKYCFFI